jgi:serine phosphatase RsbU (regulator of sigma subunit)
MTEIHLTSKQGQRGVASPAAPSERAHGLVVAEPTLPRTWRELADVVEWREIAARGAGAVLREELPGILLVDGGLSKESLGSLVAELGAPGDPARPAVLLITPDGQRDGLESLITGHADDVVNGSLGAGELRARVLAALRVRGFVTELSRKNVELEALYARVESMATRMGEELRLASKVQRSLMPPPVSHPRLDVAREFMPVREIGGDFFDLVALCPDRLAFAIGDVMGKGVPAALLAASLKACLRARLVAGAAAVEEIVTGVNRLFWEVSPTGLFATLFFGIFDLERGWLEFVNAGHHYPFLVRPDGRVEDLIEGGTVLGLVEESSYRMGRVGIGRDDTLVFYSDGVTDREDLDAEVFGVERLKEAALKSRGDDARIALYTLLGEVQGWSAGRPAGDDMTLVVARVR